MKQSRSLVETGQVSVKIWREPDISQGEQSIVNDALTLGHRLIRLQHEGMSDLHAPSERFVAPTARGQILFLAPWPNQPQSVHPTKSRFELLNAICRVLCGLHPSPPIILPPPPFAFPFPSLSPRPVSCGPSAGAIPRRKQMSRASQRRTPKF
ncbi:MAG: hypothetical protein IJ739_04595 [Bacteroidaceae bacterium]|nr:hypothetical protein [Bacteroidaceae bacterium]